MRALALNCTLKRSPDDSNTAALTRVVLEALEERGVETELVRVVDHVVEPGVVSDPVSDADERPALREKVVAAGILIVATPTWLGQQSSVSKRVLERMDALLSETKEERPPRSAARSSTSASPSLASRGPTGTRGRGRARRST
jgi:multimeric flavodoxin WrbA